MKHVGVALGTALMVATACGGDGDGTGRAPLTTSISVPPQAGDATGTAHSGDWDIALYWTRCTGTCSVQTLLGPASACDVDDRVEDTATVTQTDGTLRFDANETPSGYDGGVDADGWFDALGLATQNGGDVEIKVRVQGMFTGDTLTGLARSHTVGVINGSALDCFGEIEVTGSRR